MNNFIAGAFVIPLMIALALGCSSEHQGANAGDATAAGSTSKGGGPGLAGAGGSATLPVQTCEACVAAACGEQLTSCGKQSACDYWESCALSCSSPKACDSCAFPSAQVFGDEGVPPALALVSCAKAQTECATACSNLVTGCVERHDSTDTSCQCGQYASNETCAPSLWNAAGICREGPCYCHCSPWLCKQTNATDCECNTFTGTDNASNGYTASQCAGSRCCFDDRYDTCSCDSSASACFGSKTKVPSCSFEDVRSVLAKVQVDSHDDTSFSVLVDSCDFRAGNQSKADKCTANSDSCKKKGCGIPIECAPGVRCCNPTCDLATDHCVLTCN